MLLKTVMMQIPHKVIIQTKLVTEITSNGRITNFSIFFFFIAYLYCNTFLYQWIIIYSILFLILQIKKKFKKFLCSTRIFFYYIFISSSSWSSYDFMTIRVFIPHSQCPQLPWSLTNSFIPVYNFQSLVLFYAIYPIFFWSSSWLVSSHLLNL